MKEAELGYYNFSGELKKNLSQENVELVRYKGWVKKDIVGLLSSSTQNSYGFRSVREDVFECENSGCSEIL